MKFRVEAGGGIPMAKRLAGVDKSKSSISPMNQPTFNSTFILPSFRQNVRLRARLGAKKLSIIAVVKPRSVSNRRERKQPMEHGARAKKEILGLHHAAVAQPLPPYSVP